MRTLVYAMMALMAFGLLFPGSDARSRTREQAPFPELNTTLKTGDVVLRSGKGWISRFFRNMSITDRVYSHAGILVVTGNGYFVCHMIGTNNGSGLRVEKLEEFCNSTDNTAFAIYRYKSLKGHESRMEQFLQQIKLQNPSFDESFSLETDDSIYCTELVYKALLFSCGLQLPVSSYHNDKFVSLDNLYLNPQAELIFKTIYNQNL